MIFIFNPLVFSSFSGPGVGSLSANSKTCLGETMVSGHGSVAQTYVMTPAQTVVILDQTLPSATIGTAYSTTLAATGGTGPYTWALTGSLPAGLTFSAGVISGTATGSPATAT